MPVKTVSFPAPPEQPAVVVPVSVSPSVPAAPPVETPDVAPGGPVPPPAPVPVVEVRRVQVTPRSEAKPAVGAPGRDPIKAAAADGDVVYRLVANCGGFYVGDTLTEADFRRAFPGLDIADWLARGIVVVS